MQGRGHSDMGKKLSNPPVFYTLAQFKFNPIVGMSEYIPKLQDRLRRIGYPDFRQENQLAINIRRTDESQPEIQNIQQVRWSFTNSQNTEGYLLHAESLVFHSTSYESFQDFSKKALDGLRLLHELIELAFVELIGLRYLDAVSPLGGDDINCYLTPSLLGLSSIIGGSLAHAYSETQTQIESGTLVARAVMTESGLALPPDLFPFQLKLLPKFASITGRNAVLDIDYFVTQRFDFDVKRSEELLQVAHGIITDAFRASVTERALSVWE
jgi:uncharacterized protein (TIGR04255 family)